MKPKVVATFTLIFTLAILLSANPVMIMPPVIFASPSDDGGGSSDGNDGSSENEQPQEESDSQVPEEETVTKTESVSVTCPDGSQAPTTEECPIASRAMPTENVLWGDYFYVNPACEANPNDPACKSSSFTSGTTLGTPSGSVPADTGSEKNPICTNSPEVPCCKSQTTADTTTWQETQKEADSRFSVGFDAICLDSNPDCKSTTTPGTSTTEPLSTDFAARFICQSPTDPACANTTTESTVPTDTTFYCKANPSSPECNKTPTTPVEVEVSKNANGSCPAGSHFVAFGGKNGAPSGSKCVSDNPPSKTTTTPATNTTPVTTTTPTPATKTVFVTKTNINNDHVTVREDGGLTVQKLDGAVTPTANCPPQSATIVLGPSPMENGKARILTAFDPCILTSEKLLLHLPDEKGIQLVGAKIQDGQTTQSTIVSMQRVAPTAPGQAQYFIDLTKQSTGLDLASENPVNLADNVDALLLMNLGGQNIQLGADNTVKMDASLTPAAAIAI